MKGCTSLSRLYNQFRFLILTVHLDCFAEQLVFENIGKMSKEKTS